MTSRLSRRRFLACSSAAVLASHHPLSAAEALATPTSSSPALPEPSAARLPRWRGFNLLEKFSARDDGNPPFRGADFEMIREWGFNFVRLPMSYRCWTPGEPSRWREIDERQLRDVDTAVKLGQTHGIHVNLNLHRAPGYCVNPPAEPLDLFRDAQALDACAFQWATLARRYQGIPNRHLSFDLLNEPKDLPEADYVRVVKALVEAIRAVDPQRLIIADGLRWGRQPVAALAGLGVAQSTRGYDPMRVSHHGASWVNGERWPVPDWPLREGETVWDRDRLSREIVQPWRDLAARGVGVHVGEWGCFHRTPHAVALRWMADFLELWRAEGWGWALWEFRGSFGILDSGRKDVAYVDHRGHQLDRELLKLLQAG